MVKENRQKGVNFSSSIARDLLKLCGRALLNKEFTAPGKKTRSEDELEKDELEKKYRFPSCRAPRMSASSSSSSIRLSRHSSNFASDDLLGEREAREEGIFLIAAPESLDVADLYVLFC